MTDATQKLKAGLYLVATPIGNLRDITLRALDTLRAADIIACEDTRTSGKLLKAYDIKAQLLPLHDHNEEQQSARLIAEINGGRVVALISDAGMPLISDPGYKLVRTARDAGVYITSLPGANAPLMALQLSGLPSDAFTFAGFLPHKSKARRDMLTQWKLVPSTLIFFESAQRLEQTLDDIQAVMGDRRVTIARELTKLFEEVKTAAVTELLNAIRENGPPKGEIVLLIEAAQRETEVLDIDSLLVEALETKSLKDAVAEIVDRTGASKNEIYARALEIQKNG